MNIRIVRALAGQLEEGSKATLWRDKLAQATVYKDELVEGDDAEVAKLVADVTVIYACKQLSPTEYEVVKDTGLTAKMGHTFAGWPISAPVGKVTDMDPLAPKESGGGGKVVELDPK
jgi:hypothetical protein